MRPVNQQNLGVIIAYLIPGFTALWGASHFSVTLRGWLGASPAASPTVSGFLYVTLASLGLGIFVNTLRRLTIDPLHHRTGIVPRDWDYAQLQENITAVEFLVAHQFRYYQFHANLCIALGFTTLVHLSRPGAWSWSKLSVILVVEVILWLGSRDNLWSYFRRLEDVLGKTVLPTSSDSELNPSVAESVIDNAVYDR